MAQSVHVYFPDDFALVFVAVVSGIDEFGGMSGVGSKSGLAVRHMQSEQPPGDQVADAVVYYLVPRHSLGVNQARSENDFGFSVPNGIDELSDIFGIVLTIAIHSDDNVGSERFCRFDAGFGSSAFAPVYFMPNGDDSGILCNKEGGISAAIIHNEYVLIPRAAYLVDDGGDDSGFIVCRYDNPEGIDRVLCMGFSLYW